MDVFRVHRDEAGNLVRLEPDDVEIPGPERFGRAAEENVMQWITLAFALGNKRNTGLDRPRVRLTVNGDFRVRIPAFSVGVPLGHVAVVNRASWAHRDSVEGVGVGFEEDFDPVAVENRIVVQICGCCVFFDGSAATNPDPKRIIRMQNLEARGARLAAAQLSSEIPERFFQLTIDLRGGASLVPFAAGHVPVFEPGHVAAFFLRGQRAFQVFQRVELADDELNPLGENGICGRCFASLMQQLQQTDPAPAIPGERGRRWRSELRRSRRRVASPAAAGP